MIYISVVNCQLCGKEIGPFRLLRDTEFCSSSHRKRYGQRLGQALNQLVTPDLVSKKTASFQVSLPFQEGVHRNAKSWTLFEIGRHPVQIRRTWSIPMPPRLGTYFLKTPGASIVLPPPVLSCRLTEPSRPPSGQMVKGRWVPPQMAGGAMVLFSSETMASAWPEATARMTVACARLKLAWFQASTRLNLPAVVPAHADGMPAKESLDDSPLIAGPATLGSPIASRPVYPSMAALLAARLSNSMGARLVEEIAQQAGLRPSIPAVPAGVPMVAAPAALDRPGQTVSAGELVALRRGISSPVLPQALELQLALERQVAELPKNFQPIASICWMPVPAAQPVERMIHARVTLAATGAVATTLPTVNGWTIGQVQAPEASIEWMRVPPAEAAERLVRMMAAGESCASLELAKPSIDALSIARPQEPEAHTEWISTPRAEAAERLVAASMSASMIEGIHESAAPGIAGCNLR